jgi:hypothetical protein
VTQFGTVLNSVLLEKADAIERRDELNVFIRLLLNRLDRKDFGDDPSSPGPKVGYNPPAHKEGL